MLLLIKNSCFLIKNRHSFFINNRIKIEILTFYLEKNKILTFRAITLFY